MNEGTCVVVEQLQDNRVDRKVHAVMAWVVWSNTDLTEGRGAMLPIAVTSERITAQRLARKAGVMGCDADVTYVECYRINGLFYGPQRLQPPSEEEVRIEAARLAHEEAIKAARAAGLSDEQLKILAAGPSAGRG